MSQTEINFEIAKIIISILGFSGTIITIGFGAFQYYKNEKWKQKEFVAKEVKEFESNLLVKNAFTMIDWGKRRINLNLIEEPKPEETIVVNRKMQTFALLPHTIKKDFPSPNLKISENNSTEDSPLFTWQEAKIRDSYDAFLDYLERFGHFIESDLVKTEDFRPYLSYWIDSITETDSKNTPFDLEDAKWRLALLTYINFYGYNGVVKLFGSFRKNIKFNGTICKKLEELVKDEEFVKKLKNSFENQR
jgi:hypothetical protein